MLCTLPITTRVHIAYSSTVCWVETLKYWYTCYLFYPVASLILKGIIYSNVWCCFADSIFGSTVQTANLFLLCRMSVFCFANCIFGSTVQTIYLVVLCRQQQNGCILPTVYLVLQCRLCSNEISVFSIWFCFVFRLDFHKKVEAEWLLIEETHNVWKFSRQLQRQRQG